MLSHAEIMASDEENLFSASDIEFSVQEKTAGASPTVAVNYPQLKRKVFLCPETKSESESWTASTPIPRNK
jgi:hypothetical protein